jgi:hypothetical protein
LLLFNGFENVVGVLELAKEAEEQVQHDSQVEQVRGCCWGLSELQLGF